ncbi:MAG: undecaprenyl-diphosphate phosphatase [Patescibacteria group bacterium]|nr:undecaprenyl-diphosphate phosphatase [Patescibacteria group bacterium]
MTLTQAILLSFIEGITEFLPISSTGHLILASHFFNIPQSNFVKTFQIFIQFGAILAVIVLYFNKLSQKTYLWKHILIAFTPAGIIGFFLYRFIKDILLEEETIVAWMLVIGGIFLIAFEKFFTHTRQKTIHQLTIVQTLFIGIGQAIAVIPGVSRSAATILSGILIGLSKKEAIEFSFLLAVPTIAVAGVFDLFQSSLLLTSNEIALLSVGFVASFFFAILAIRFFLSILHHQSLTFFGIYRIVLGLLVLFFL